MKKNHRCEFHLELGGLKINSEVRMANKIDTATNLSMAALEEIASRTKHQMTCSPWEILGKPPRSFHGREEVEMREI